MMDFKILMLCATRQAKEVHTIPFLQNPSAGPLSHSDRKHIRLREVSRRGGAMKGKRVKPGRALRNLRQGDNDLQASSSYTIRRLKHQKQNPRCSCSHPDPTALKTEPERGFPGVQTCLG